MFNSFLFYYGLPLFNKTKEYIQTVYTYINNAYDNIVFGLNSDVLLFYKDDDHPYFQYYFNNKNSSITVWKYNKYKKLFYNYNCSAKDTKRFPVLSASIGTIKDNIFTSLINLDEFIDTLYIESSNCGYPTLTQFIYAYMYTNKIYIEKSKELYINYLDTSANECIKKLYYEDFNFCSEKK